MALNFERLKKDLARLIDDGGKLELALLVKVHGEKKVKEALQSDEADRGFPKLPTFNVGYEAWYSEALAFIRQMLPDRLVDFKEHFEAPRNRKEITYASYRIQDALKGLQVTRSPYNEIVVDHKAAVPHFAQQLAILK